MLLKLKSIGLASIIAVSTMLIPTIASAITPTPAMLAQFKQLPKAEQQRLMKQYGLSPQMLGGLNQKSSPLETPEAISPRLNAANKIPAFDNQTPETAAFEEAPLKAFGYDLFAGEPTTFAPVSDLPVPSEYQMGPGDQVLVQLYGKENNQYELTVSRSGQLQLPELGPVNVTGLTFNEMKQKLTQLIESNYIGMQASISLGELRSIRIFVAGDAYKPGSYTVSSLSSITQALYIAGGINDIGSLRDIQLKRNGKLVTSFDLYDLLMKGDASNDKRLQSGDVVFIPPVGATVSIKGQVRRPAIYELKGNETMAQLLRLAGGLNRGAFPAASIVERFNDHQLPSLLNVDLSTRAGLNIVAQHGDILTVQNTALRKHKQIALLGAVNRPGLYQWSQGMRITDLIKSTWRDLKNSADLSFALVTREINPQGDIKVIQIDLQQAMRGDNSANIKLNARDTLLIFNNSPLSLERTELNKLIAQQVKPFVAQSEFESIKVEQSRLFATGFENLMAAQLLLPESDLAEQENALLNELAAQKVEEVLHKLYNDHQKLKMSASLTRNELLFPVIAKLKSQPNDVIATQLVSISGEVRFPGVYPLTAQQGVADLIQAAGGLKDSAYLNNAELTRTEIGAAAQATIEHVTINLTDGHSDSIKLKSKDHLQVLTVPDWQKNMQVEIKGEVRFPGTYTIKNGETMMAVVARAGGFTANAFIKGAVFTRESVKQQEKQQILTMANQLRRDIATRGLSQEGNFVNFDDASKMLQELEQLQSVGRMVINLAKLQTIYQSNHNSQPQSGLRLDDGDKLYVPSQQQIVTVVGEIQHASSHFHDQTIDITGYLTLAGGIKQRANEDGIYIVRADGSVVLPQQSFWFGQHSQIEPGDTIVVPLDTEYKDNLTLWSQVTGILYNTAVALAAVNGL